MQENGVWGMYAALIRAICVSVGVVAKAEPAHGGGTSPTT